MNLFLSYANYTFQMCEHEDAYLKLPFEFLPLQNLNAVLYSVPGGHWGGGWGGRGGGGGGVYTRWVGAGVGAGVAGAGADVEKAGVTQRKLPIVFWHLVSSGQASRPSSHSSISGTRGRNHFGSIVCLKMKVMSLNVWFEGIRSILTNAGLSSSVVL